MGLIILLTAILQTDYWAGGRAGENGRRT